MATISGTVNGIAGGWVRVFAFDLNNLAPYAYGPANLTLTNVLASDFYATANAGTGVWSSTSAKIGSRYLLMAYPINTPINTTLVYYGDVTNPTDAEIVHVMSDVVTDIDFTLQASTSFMSGTVSDVPYAGAGNITIVSLLRPFGGGFILENQGVPSNVWDGNIVANNTSWYHATPADERYVVMAINQDVAGAAGEAMFSQYRGETGVYCYDLHAGNYAALDFDFDERLRCPTRFSSRDNQLAYCSKNPLHMISYRQCKCAECDGPLASGFAYCRTDPSHQLPAAQTIGLSYDYPEGYHCNVCGGPVGVSGIPGILSSVQGDAFVGGNLKTGESLSRGTNRV